MDAVKIGAAIKALRIQAEYTQRDLADCLNVTDKAVSKWERGLSIPDVSIVTKLSLILNCDVDNLLEGNITYLEKSWQGFLLLKENDDIFAGSEVYGKPLVYIYLSYFMLAGIGDIYISCSARDKEYIEANIGNGERYGIRLIFLADGENIPSTAVNTMVIYNNPFIYGPNLTKYFQRAMSRMYGISVLAIEKDAVDSENTISYDKHKMVKSFKSGTEKHCAVPIVFFPKKYFDQIVNIGNITELTPLYAEPIGNGMIEYLLADDDSLLDASVFLRMLKKRMGKEVYDLKKVAKNRKFIE
ncbi:MAG: helix-turn-helix domain-containing protein [Ruminococcus sp.]|nr:helix-turn-helix domain-containing protein [Ruminococcus sp.]